MKLIRSLYLNQRFFISLAAIIVLFVTAFILPEIIIISRLIFFGLIILTALDILILYSLKNGIQAGRIVSDRLSNGDENKVQIIVENKYSFKIGIHLIDEIPYQFQKRNWYINNTIDANSQKAFNYSLKPVKRGEYHFGKINVYVYSFLHLTSKRYSIEQERNVAVYPSFLQMRKYELMAVSNRIIESGIKKIRKIGHTLEFDHIKNYVRGDDVRVMNWKATARRNKLMINQYQDEKSQNIYNVLDMGRTMKMPFEGMTLLDYAINTSLAISNIAIKKEDKAGLITFADKPGVLLPAGKRDIQMKKILELLYKQNTGFLESDFQMATSLILKKIYQRSLILFYTNFESLNSMKRKLFFLKEIAKKHLLIIIFFNNTELEEITTLKAKKIQEIYTKAIAEKFIFEKKQITKELSRYGIHSILTDPIELSINTINKYLEIKAKALI